ncbi:MAG TPA: Ku protein [Planctomycetota bacterium]|nr:Ku protein [Planctomycetota bacterium]
MATATWKGSLSFGLVEIPVSLEPAEKPDEIHFTQLDKRNLAPVGYERVNKRTGEKVPWDEIVRGFEYDKDRYVVLGDAELKRANVEATRTIEIVEFVSADEIEPWYFEKPYYVLPLKKGSKGYSLLLETLRRTGRVGIAKVVIRTRQHVGALVPRGPVLVLNLLRFAHELRAPDLENVPDGKPNGAGVSKKEIEMAETLVEGMVEKWKPEKFHDDYRDDVLALVDKKVKSGKTEEIPEEEKEEEAPRGEIFDLMPLLKRSVERTGHRRARPTRAQRPRRASRKSA